MQYLCIIVQTWRVDTAAVVNIEYQYLWSPPIHTFYILFPLGWSTQPRVAEVYGRCLQEEQA